MRFPQLASMGAPCSTNRSSENAEVDESEWSSDTEGPARKGMFAERKAPAFKPEERVKYAGPGPWSTTYPNAELAPRVAPEGFAGAVDCPPMTLMQCLQKAAEVAGESTALLVERPLPTIEDKKVPPALPIEEWTTWTYQKYLADVRNAAKGFIGLGLQQFESVNIWGFNAPEWHISALGAMFAGAKCAGIYPTDTPETAAYKVVHSQGAVVVCEDRGKVDRLASSIIARGDCRRLKAFVAYGFKPEQGEKVQGYPLISWEALIELGARGGQEADIDLRLASIRPSHCAALIYTSGTTGDPKAVMTSHDSVSFEGRLITHVLSHSCGFATQPGNTERILSYLPLSHVAGMMVDIVAPLIVSGTTSSQMSVYFARPYDLKEKAIRDRLCVAQPTVFLGVPLVWEKIADQIRALGAQASWATKQIASLAKSVALDHAMNQQLDGNGSVPAFLGLADKVVLSKIKARLGLQHCKYALTGAAPIRMDTLEFFGSLGIQINEVYGMSECNGACTFSTDQVHKWGSCGWELPGFEVKAFIVDPLDLNKKVECPRSPGTDDLDEKYQGELCFRGRSIMMGYMACPDMSLEHQKDIAKKTSESIDSDGWLHSGDKGMITVDGLVKITGRYKELIIGEGGENIAPVPIEDAVKAACDGICEVMMVGDKQKYNVALVTLKAVGANGEVAGTDDLDAGAKRVNGAVTTISAAIDDKLWIDTVTAAIQAANKDGKVCPNNAFKIQKFTILPTNFSEEGGELTPTKKLKRKVVETAYAELISRLYATDGVYIRHTAAA